MIIISLMFAILFGLGLFFAFRPAMNSSSAELDALIHDCEKADHSWDKWSDGKWYQWRTCKHCGLKIGRSI